MASFNFEDDFDKQCGEIFLTLEGNMIFNCTLCESIYKDFRSYDEHITMKHILEDKSLDGNNDNQDDLLETKEIERMDVYENEELLDEEENAYSNDFDNSAKVEAEASCEDTLDDKRGCNNEIFKPKSKARKRNRKEKERIHKCSTCSFASWDRSNLISHMKRHLERKYECSQCSKRFFTRTELRTHIRSHTGERPYLCITCGRSFKTSGLLTDHVKRHTNNRSKECEICGKKFYNQDLLKVHLPTHSNERPFQCNVCPAKFKRANALRNHIKIHENKREYECHLCLARFNQNPGLRSHLKSKHSFKNPLQIENEGSDTANKEFTD